MEEGAGLHQSKTGATRRPLACDLPKFWWTVP